MELAVKVLAVARPEELVVAVFTPPANAPPGPDAGAVKVTTTPGTGLPPLSLTVACNAVPNVVPIVALCGVPLVAVMEAGAPGALVRTKSAAVAPVALATTL